MYTQCKTVFKTWYVIPSFIVKVYCYSGMTISHNTHLINIDLQVENASDDNFRKNLVSCGGIGDDHCLFKHLSQIISKYSMTR